MIVRAGDLPVEIYGYPGEFHLLESHLGVRRDLLCIRELLMGTPVATYID